MNSEFPELPWEINEQNFPLQGSMAEQWKFLLRYAILAPSTRNTQPWKFCINNDQLDIYADKSHWLKLADADQRGLYTGVGCVLENLLVAARYFELDCSVTYFPAAGNENWVAAVNRTSRPATSTAENERLFYAIIDRQSNHHGFKPTTIPAAVQAEFQACCKDPISLYLTDDPALKQQLDKLTVLGDAIEFADPAYLEELYESIESGKVGEDWVVAKLHRVAVAYLQSQRSDLAEDTQRLANAPLVGLVISRENDRRSQVLAGQAFEAIWLAATASGISLQAFREDLQIPALKTELARLTGIRDAFPQQLFRVGYADRRERHYTPRRSLEEFLFPVSCMPGEH